MNSLVIKDIFQKENITLYQSTEFDFISNDVGRAIIRSLKKEVVLVPIFLNAEFTLDIFINDIKKYRKLEVHDNILNLYGIAERECSKSYLLVMEYPNGGTLQQYLKKNFNKLNWNIKIAFAKQIADVLMFLHANDCSPVYLTSEKIFVHNESIMLGNSVLIEQSRKSLNSLEKIHGAFQYTDSQYLKIQDAVTNQKSSDIYSLGVLLFEIASGKRPIKMESPFRVDLLNAAIKRDRGDIDPEALRGYLKIYTDCCQYDRNLRPSIVQVVKDLEKIGVNDAGQSKSSLGSNSPSDEWIPETDIFIKHLFDFFSKQYNMQNFIISPNLVKKYIRDFNGNPVKVFRHLICHPQKRCFTSMIGFFYENGIGTIRDYQMAFEFYSDAASGITDVIKRNSIPSLFIGICEVNRSVGQLCLANLYLDGKGIEQDQKKSFQMMLKAAEGGSSRALNCMAFCYDNGYGLEKDENSAFRLYLKSAEQGNLLAQCNLGICYQEGIGTSINEIKGFQLHLRSFISGSITATYRIGDCYFDGRGTRKNKRMAFEWYLTSSEDDYNMAQSDAGYCYGTGTGTLSDQKKAFEYYLKAAHNGDTESQRLVGIRYLRGIGVKRDVVKSIFWLNLSKENGDVSSANYLEEILDQIP